ncbi:RagB/SusD family nutrient uptake outer membrane protein [Mucilaginibacter sp. OK098]|uniref:RagB/SusD family nutrient uptake outer membrane protein n=1 Tax=Mucilaginibacter sp. OK098 TaxID=1855297 RepID=UPI000916ABFB|nr:RagB/SusD family nutrient uptake outer membrane protein [Mucilaginibacter sp. OK098]SHM99843.1 Starch-binding associating with outer membrane [Mucilaginibacter sp. OK098]
MKKFSFKLIALGAIIFLTTINSCKKILNQTPAGVLAGPTLANKAGVDGLLIGAYSLLDGYYQGQPGSAFASGISNWSWGGVGSDDSYKGSSTGDQRDEGLTAIEQHVSINPTDGYLGSKWQVCYAGIVRANNVIQEVPLVKDGSLTDAAGQAAIAEARFLRGVYHFELAKVWQNVPYVDETVTYAAGNLSVGNGAPIWDKIEADFAAAMTKLPKTQPQAGRANYYAAEAFLAKAYIFDHQYDKALPLLTDCINNGTTASGAHYALEPYANNFNALTKNGPESVFAAQMTVADGSNGQNDDAGDVLNFPGGGTYSGCCGFYTPSYHLANAFKVDANGLPMFQIDGATGFPKYDDVNLGNDHGVGAGTAYTPTAEAVDSRLDWTVGRRGIPYLDWGLGGGEPWTRGDLVPYVPIKNVFYHSAQASTTDTQAGWAGSQGVANNYNIIRFADIYLWRAECYILGTAPNLALAEADVNAVRSRAALPSNWVHTFVDNSDPSKGFTNTPAANYKVGLYTGQFAANGQAYALGALMIERQLEFGMEGQRFFDLQRMDGRFGGKQGTGYMAGVMNAYYKADNRIANPTLGAAKFTAGRDEVYPLPQSQVDIEGGKLKQNPNY